MLAHYLPHVYVLTWIDKELTTILQLVDSISKGIASIHRDHRTVYTTLNLALVWLILLESVGHDSLALTGSKHIGTQSDDTTRWDIKLDIYTLALALHRCHLALTTGYHIDHLR